MIIRIIYLLRIYWGLALEKGVSRFEFFFGGFIHTSSVWRKLTDELYNVFITIRSTYQMVTDTINWTLRMKMIYYTIKIRIEIWDRDDQDFRYKHEGWDAHCVTCANIYFGIWWWDKNGGWLKRLNHMIIKGLNSI